LSKHRQNANAQRTKFSANSFLIRVGWQFDIFQLILGRRLSTAAFLAHRLEFSERTVYRDIADLQFQVVPIEGVAGIGFRLGPGFDLPPLMLSAAEKYLVKMLSRP